MDLKLFGTTFVAIFIAELGDKTQLATLSLAAEGRTRLTVFCAAALALVASTAVAVLGASVVARYVPLALVKKAAGVLFIVLGVLTLWERSA